MARTVPPPRADRSSPPPPPSARYLSIYPRPVAVVVDTNVVFTRHVVPLVASGLAGDLAVYWSPTIMREVLRVAYRERITRMLRQLGSRSGGALDQQEAVSAVERALDFVDQDAEPVLRVLEAAFRWSADVDTDETYDKVRDPQDRPLFRAAQAAGARFLLTRDQRHLPHGEYFYGVQCWHPDTFLTSFYQQDMDAYTRAIQVLETLPATVSLSKLIRQVPNR